MCPELESWVGKIYCSVVQERKKNKPNGNTSNQIRVVFMLVGYSAKLDSFILQIRYILSATTDCDGCLL